ncbi:MAG: heavy metal response regulator transcription factor [Verrucomicrobia bacterium]|nr:heavy metal response regulator transcription factor [Verrucomicrobiota bacterium]MDA1086224.1 heavy metal response regulator transcription factor [Verrucomicrobiota bacterium]
MRVLVVEDHRRVANFIVKGLREESYAVDLADNGQDGFTMAKTTEYDCVILDLMLPGMSGLEVLRQLREKGVQTPVIVLTARDAVADKIAGLDSGADDYLTKPFAFDELLARMRALMRRRMAVLDVKLQIEDLSVDIVTREVRRGDTLIDLTPKEFALLEYLLRNKDRIMTRTSIIEHVWDMHYDSETNVVDVLIRYLRRKIDDDFSPKLIHTVRGVGYVLKVAAG